jgi:hypothetical protein
MDLSSTQVFNVGHRKRKEKRSMDIVYVLPSGKLT